MNDNLPPLPEPDTLDRGWELSAYSEEQMKDYARAAIEKDRERQSVPSGWYVTNATKSTVKHWPITEDQAIALAAAPQPQPVQPTNPQKEN